MMLIKQNVAKITPRRKIQHGAKGGTMSIRRCHILVLCRIVSIFLLITCTCVMLSYDNPPTKTVASNLNMCTFLSAGI